MTEEMKNREFKGKGGGVGLDQTSYRGTDTGCNSFT